MGQMTDIIDSLKSFDKGTSHTGKITENLKKLEGLSCSQEFRDRFKKESSIKIIGFSLSLLNLSAPHSQTPKSHNFPLNTKKIGLHLMPKCTKYA